MISTDELKNRNRYLNKLISFQDTEPVKVITGIRRCGKSSLLKLMIQHLLQSGVSKKQIVSMNFESNEFIGMSSEALYQYVKDRVIEGQRLYIFLDEVQRIPAWENAVNAFRVDLDCDIYVTGSNSYLLSSEYATYLSGRYVEIKILPLSFREFLDFHKYEVRKITNGLIGDMFHISDQNGESYQLSPLFNAYMRFGGMPGISKNDLGQENASTMLNDIYNTVVMQDILQRKSIGHSQVTDIELLHLIVRFLADNIGNNVSASSMANTLGNEGMLDTDKRTGKPSTHTVLSYIGTLRESFLFYPIKRFDIKGRQYLRTLGKYYIVDLGIRNFLLGFRERDRGHAIENLVYFELLRRGYDVAVGKVGDLEIDFIANSLKEKIYFQVTENMINPEVRARELRPLQMIRDNYPKIVLSLDPGLDNHYDGIKSLNLIDWLLDDPADQTY